MDHKSPLFGEELRRKRITAGLSLAQLAQMVHYSKGQLSKVERGIKTPSRDLVRLCDAALEADGELASLAGSRPASRRQVLAAGALAMPAIYLGGTATPGSLEYAGLAGTFRSLFDHYRKLGQTTDPEILIPVLAGQVNVIQEIAKNDGGRTRSALLIIASRYAEYTGWLVRETAADSGALWWTRRAVDLANAAGDFDFAAYGLVRHALVTLYRGDAVQTTQLAVRAQVAALPPRIRGLAAAREAAFQQGGVPLGGISFAGSTLCRAAPRDGTAGRTSEARLPFRDRQSRYPARTALSAGRRRFADDLADGGRGCVGTDHSDRSAR